MKHREPEAEVSHLPDRCWNCGLTDWIARQEVFAPTRMDAIVWHRRSWCHCGAAQDELRSPALLAVRSADAPTDWRGGNPFA